jgi:hypothetical protein
MKALLADMGGSQWRVREAAAAATADLLQGRRWPQLRPHFEQLWSMTLRWVLTGRGRVGRARGDGCPPGCCGICGPRL